MSTRLTNDQKNAFYWILGEIRAGRLEDPFMIVWAGGQPIGNIPIPGRPTVVYPDTVTESNLAALVATGRLGEKRTPLYSEYTLIPDLFTAPPVRPPTARPQPAAPEVPDVAEKTETAAPDPHARRVRLARFIDAYFDREELQNLCFDLAVDYHNLAGEKKETKARNLVAHMDNRGRLAELERQLAIERPEQFRQMTNDE